MLKTVRPVAVPSADALAKMPLSINAIVVSAALMPSRIVIETSMTTDPG